MKRTTEGEMRAVARRHHDARQANAPHLRRVDLDASARIGSAEDPLQELLYVRDGDVRDTSSDGFRLPTEPEWERLARGSYWEPRGAFSPLPKRERFRQVPWVANVEPVIVQA